MKIIENQNTEVFKRISEAVKENDGYCPCMVFKNEDTRCMCKEFREQTKSGPCRCGRYIKVMD